MDLKFTKEAIMVKETVLDNCFEQAVETDYILPDYYPDIFRVVKSQITARVVSNSIIGNDMSDSSKKLCYDTEAIIRVWYLSENSKTINCIEQKMSFSKNVELAVTSDNPKIYICPKTDYVNCRVINKRRLDIRGAISTKIKVCDIKSQNIICDANGGNIQLKKNTAVFPSKIIVNSKKITVIEELELGIAKPPILSVIKADCKILSKEYKVVSSKLVVKGEAEIDMLYTCSKDNEHGIEGMKFTVPFSQIMEIDGIDDNFDIDVDISKIGCDVVTKGSGESTSFECELMLLVNCTASELKSCNIIEDAYSTTYDCELVTNNIKIENAVKKISDNVNCKKTLSLNDSEIHGVIDCNCEISNIATHFSQESKSFIINGNVVFESLVETKDGFPVIIESDSIFEHTIDCNGYSDAVYLEPKISVLNYNFAMSNDNSVEISTEILVEGTIIEKADKKIITDICIKSENKKICNTNCALKLYYADENEDIWEIAKRNSTSVQAILDENETCGEKLTDKGMLLIPIIN